MAKFEPQRFGVAFQRKFCRTVHPLKWHPNQAGNRSNDNDMRRVAFAEVRQCRSNQAMVAKEVSVKLQACFVYRGLLKAACNPHSGIAHNGIEAARALNHVCYGSFNAVVVGDIHLDELELTVGVSARGAFPCRAIDLIALRVEVIRDR
jgi:hypothetical protein